MLAEYYLVLKALHILSVIAWMAGLLYLPRLYVYHVDVAPNDKAYEIFSLMEQRLLKIIMRAAALATLTFGVMLWMIPGIINKPAGWFHVKLLAVVGLFAIHGMCMKWGKDFWSYHNQKSARFFRIINEIPFVLAIVAVFMVVLKPF